VECKVVEICENRQKGSVQTDGMGRAGGSPSGKEPKGLTMDTWYKWSMERKLEWIRSNCYSHKAEAWILIEQIETVYRSGGR
jgi:hypothetical protein